MKLGFIGLGQMGKYCALNLLKNRGELHVNDIDPEAVAFLISHGAKKSDSNAELMSVCDIVFLCLPNGDIVEKIIFGDNKPNTIYSDIAEQAAKSIQHGNKNNSSQLSSLPLS